MISSLKRTFRPYVVNRKCHLYGVGIERTGTTSICRFFPHLRTWHEHELKELWNIVIKKRTGNDISRRVKNRDKKLYLDVESNHLLAHISEDLVGAFPQSKYVLTIREPQSWLESVLRWELTKPSLLTTSPWKPILDFYYGPKEGYRFPWMAENNLYPIDNYLRAWRDHNKHVLDSVPSDQLLVIRTRDLSSKADRISSFAGIDQEPQTDRHNSSDHSVQPFWLSDETYVEEKSKEICGEVMEELEKRAV